MQSNSVRPDFLPDVDGVYTFQLTVSNATQTSAPSAVQFTAVTGNVPPNADAGKPHNGVVGKSVTLDGVASFDPDQGPQPLAYLWQVQQAPAASAVGGKSIANFAQSNASFTPDVAGAYILSLQVSDGVAFNSDTVTITVAAADAPPNAVAGRDRRVLPGTLVALDGSASFDPDGQALTYQWQFASGTLDNAALQGGATAKPSFTPVVTGFYVARLTVSDGVASSDNVTVLATTACDANADGLVNQVDFDLMTAISGQAAQAGDPLDVTGDGVIDAKDIAACQVTTVPQLPTISVDKATLVFNYVQGDPAPAAQTLTVTGGGAVIAFQVSTNGTPWLAVNPSSANTNATVQVTLDPSKLPVGNYSAPLTILAQRANPGQTLVTIVVHVLEPPRLTLTPAVLSFQWVQGGKLPAVQVVNVGSVTRNLAFAAQASADWIAVTPASGQTLAPVSVSIANLDKLVAGSYKGSVTFTATNGGPQVVQVNLVVLPSPPVVTGVINAASGLSGAIVPGELVNVSGLYFGPARLVKQQGIGMVATSLSDTEVLFEGVPAPILQAMNGQVQAVVPFFLDGRTMAVVQVEYQGVISNTAQLTVARTGPGVFTLDASGRGQALATNADGTANSAANAAPRGGKLSIYLTGGGILNPPGFDGRIAAAPLAALVQQAAVQIGGQAATVTAAGDDAGQVEGYVQVDVTIPQNIDAGDASLVVTIGGASSQPGVTVAVR